MSKEELEILENLIKLNAATKFDFFREEQHTTLEHLLQEYKTLKEDFKELDHECERLEEIDIIKDTQIQELQKKIKVNNIKDTISEKEILNFINEAETEFDKNYISKDKIREIIKKIENNSKMAEEEIVSFMLFTFIFFCNSCI